MNKWQKDLIESNLDLPEKVLKKIWRYATAYERQDCLSAGYLGLVKAALNYNKEKGQRFSSYAWIRIRGEMLDYIRHHAPFTRNHCAACKKEGTELPEINSPVLPLPGVEPAVSDIDRLILEEAVESLNTKQQAVVLLYYYWGLTLKEVGDVLGVCETRIWKVRIDAIQRLREYYKRNLAMSKRFCFICKKRIRAHQESTSIPLMRRANRNIKGEKNIAKMAFKRTAHMDCWKRKKGQKS